MSGANAHYGTPVNPRAPGRLPGGSSAARPPPVAAGAVRFRARQRHGRLGARPGLIQRDLRPAADARTHRAHWRDRTWRRPSTCPAGSPPSPGYSANRAACCSIVAASPREIERVVVLEDAFAQAEEPVADLLRTALELMSDDLPQMVHGRIAPEGFDPWREAFRVVQAYRNLADIRWICHRPETRKPARECASAWNSRRTVTSHRLTPPGAYQPRRANTFRSVVVPGTMLALPTAPCIAPMVESRAGRDWTEFRARVMRLTCTAGVAGLPQINIPAARSTAARSAYPSSAGRAATRHCSNLPVRSAVIAAWRPEAVPCFE